MKRKFAYIFVLFSLLFSQHLGARPADEERRVMVGLIDAVDLFAQGEYKEASRIFSALIRRYPEDDALNYYMSLCTIADCRLQSRQCRLLYRKGRRARFDQFYLSPSSRANLCRHQGLRQSHRPI